MYIPENSEHTVTEGTHQNLTSYDRLIDIEAEERMYRLVEVPAFRSTYPCLPSLTLDPTRYALRHLPYSYRFHTYTRSDHLLGIEGWSTEVCEVSLTKSLRGKPVKRRLGKV